MTLLNKLFNSLLILLFITASSFAQDNLIIGEFIITKVIDGDTFRFDKLEKSCRLLGLDTEETFKDESAEMKVNELSKDWLNTYAKEKEKGGGHPAKIETPFGYKTWQWTKEFVKDVVKVRLELDETDRAIDFYGRYLAYVICIKADGTEFNYNVECVKYGYSPYFSKYGYSKRFHKEFVEAQEYAQLNNLGIWSGNELCYPDYDERVKWWDRRGESILNFEKKYKGKPGYFSILDDKDYNELKNHFGEEVTIFGTISRILTEKEPYLIRFDHNNKEHVDIVVFPDLLYLIDEMKIKDIQGEYVYFHGKLEDYNGRPEIKLKSKDQLWIE